MSHDWKLLYSLHECTKICQVRIQSQKGIHLISKLLFYRKVYFLHAIHTWTHKAWNRLWNKKIRYGENKGSVCLSVIKRRHIWQSWVYTSFCFSYFSNRVFHLCVGLPPTSFLCGWDDRCAPPCPAFICWDGVLWTFWSSWVARIIVMS
jgi:hypothetical protein